MSENGAEFENGETDVHNDDCTARPSTSRKNVYARVVVENGGVTIRYLSAALELSIGTVPNPVREEMCTLGTRMSDRTQKSMFS